MNQQIVTVYTSATDLAHVGEHFLSTPTRQIPVVKVLLGATDAKRTVDARATSQKFSTAEFDLSVVHSGHWWGDQIPVGFGVKVLRPATSHLDVLIVLAIRSCFDEQNAAVSIFCKPSSNNTATRASTTTRY